MISANVHNYVPSQITIAFRLPLSTPPNSPSGIVKLWFTISCLGKCATPKCNGTNCSYNVSLVFLNKLEIFDSDISNNSANLEFGSPVRNLTKKMPKAFLYF